MDADQEESEIGRQNLTTDQQLMTRIKAIGTSGTSKSNNLPRINADGRGSERIGDPKGKSLPLINTDGTDRGKDRKAKSGHWKAKSKLSTPLT
jgi:hypothetical protein